MKVKLYMDVYPGATQESLMAMGSIGQKFQGCKRYMIEVSIPDSAFTGDLDGVLPVEEFKEVDK